MPPGDLKRFVFLIGSSVRPRICTQEPSALKGFRRSRPSMARKVSLEWVTSCA